MAKLKPKVNQKEFPPRKTTPFKQQKFEPRARNSQPKNPQQYKQKFSTNVGPRFNQQNFKAGYNQSHPNYPQHNGQGFPTNRRPPFFKRNFNSGFNRSNNTNKQFSSFLKHKADISVQNKTSICVITNIPLTATFSEIIEFLKGYKTIKSVKFTSFGLTSPIHMSCNIEFSQKSEAKDLLKLDGTVFKTHHLRAYILPQIINYDECSVLVKNIPKDYSEEKLRNVFKNFGEVKTVIINLTSESGSVHFKNPESAKLALQQENIEIDGTSLKIYQKIVKQNNDSHEEMEEVVKEEKEETTDENMEEDDDDDKDDDEDDDEDDDKEDEDNDKEDEDDDDEENDD